LPSVLSLQSAALSALPIKHNAGASAVRTKDPVFKIEFIILAYRVFCFTLNKMGTAIQAVTALQGDKGFTVRANLARDYFVAIWAFHSFGQLFLEVMIRTDPISCLTLVLLHFGHLILVFSYSEMDSRSVKLLLHFSHLYSYLGIGTFLMQELNVAANMDLFSHIVNHWRRNNPIPCGNMACVSYHIITARLKNGAWAIPEIRYLRKKLH
jgi:hypothetical protein